MKRIYILAIVAAALLILWGLLGGARGCASKKVEQGQHQAAVAEGESNVHVQQADKLKAEAQAECEARKTAEARLDRLKKENADLLRRVAAGHGASIPPASGSSAALPDDPGADVRDAVIEKQQEILEEQDKVIESQKTELILTHQESAENKAAFESERRRAVGLQISLDAQKHVQSSERWSGRLEGGSAGVLAGFLIKALL